MSNEVETVNTNLPAHLQQPSAGADEFAAGVASGPTLPYMSIRGKQFRLRWNGEEKSTEAAELDVIMVAARSTVSKRIHLKAYEPGSIDPPDCSSTDGRVPDVGVPSPQAATCAACPHNVFGSKGKGKACNDYKRMVVLPVFDGTPMDTPVVVDVPAMSLKKKRDDRSENLYLREYFGLLAKHHIPPTGVVTKLSFLPESEYPRVRFGMSRYTTEAEYAQVQELRESDDVQDALTAREAEAPGPITEAAPAAAPAPAIPPPPAHLQGQPGGLEPPAPAPQAAPPADPPPPPRAEEPAPAVEAAPEPEAAEPDKDDDAMASVRALLGGLS